jgi:hypothetical protein
MTCDCFLKDSKEMKGHGVVETLKLKIIEEVGKNSK